MIYATADLHGYPLDKFKQLLHKAGFSDEDFLFVIGDVIDRGEHGVSLLRWLMLQPNIQLIRGNHEAVLLSCSFVFDEITEETVAALDAEKLGLFQTWCANGAEPTLAALAQCDPDTRADLLEYLRETPLYDTVSVGGRNFVMAHAGLGNYRTGKRIGEYTEQELLWTRLSADERYSDEFITLVGHTPTFHYGEEHRGRIFQTDTWMDLDTGAGYDLWPVLLRLDDMQVFYPDVS